jgi:hypothetical protein
MKRGLKGNMLPESYEDSVELFIYGQPRYACCVLCGLTLCMPQAAKTEAGWRDTQIVGFCEPCYDGLFPQEEDDSAERGATH